VRLPFTSSSTYSYFEVGARTLRPQRGAPSINIPRGRPSAKSRFDLFRAR
jgi:hypothetical protein